MCLFHMWHRRHLKGPPCTGEWSQPTSRCCGGRTAEGTSSLPPPASFCNGKGAAAELSMSPQDPKHVPMRCCQPHVRQHDLMIYLMTASHIAHTRGRGRRDAAAKTFLPLLQFSREGRHGTTQAQGSQGTWSPCPHCHEPAAAPSSSVPPCPSCLEGLHILLACFLV